MPSTLEPAARSVESTAGSIRTQAVVVIHGVGEQRPMSTLRRFVEAVLPDHESGEKYFSKPDRLSESLELRRLQNRKRPKTHFYEYYWAFEVEGTTIRHVLSWLRSLLFRRPSKVPRQLLALWSISWCLLLLILLGFVTGSLGAFWSHLTSRSWGFILSAVASLAFLLVQGVAIAYAGDAARYLSPHPRNITLRHTIRTNGLRLLRQLHACGEYDRIIVVGHSLGTVIAYDILKHLWLDYQNDYAKPEPGAQEALAKVEAFVRTLTPASPPDQIEEFQRLQHGLWQEMRRLGNGWLVTDLITAGSPLAHAAMVLADDADDLKARQAQRELPTCPPVTEPDEKDRNRLDRQGAGTHLTPCAAHLSLTPPSTTHQECSPARRRGRSGRGG